MMKEQKIWILMFLVTLSLHSGSDEKCVLLHDKCKVVRTGVADLFVDFENSNR